MRSHSLLVVLFAGVGLTACTDFYNRLYRYNEEIPLKPFVMKLVKTEFGTKDGKIALKISLQIANRSPDKNMVSRSRFVLRVAGTTAIACDQSLFESPGEETTVAIPFVISKDDIRDRLDLIVDRTVPKKEKRQLRTWIEANRPNAERLTLIEVKKEGIPSSLPGEDKWRTVHGSRW